MKLSDIGADRYDEVMSKVPELIKNLAKNKDFNAMMNRGGLDPENLESARAAAGKRIMEYFPKLMLSAKKELIAYFSLLEGKGEEEYAKKMTVGSMISGVNEMVQDVAFLNFFGLYLSPDTD